MSARMRKRHTEKTSEIIEMTHSGIVYQFPKKVAEQYRLELDAVLASDVFSKLNKHYTKPGALLKGLRARESLTQVQLAKKLRVTQSDISQMENGARAIGRTVAKRIEKLFDVNYRSFLE